MKEERTTTDAQEARDIEAWEISQKIRIGNAIPKRDQPDWRSELYFRYQLNRDYFARQENFAAAVTASMANDIRDAIKHIKTRQAKFEDSFESMIAIDPETGKKVMVDAIDEEATLERFLGGIDRDYRRALFRAWREEFRKTVDELPPHLREFLELLGKGTSQTEIALANHISRKGCFLRREKLREIFGCLLREHRNIKATEIK